MFALTPVVLIFLALAGGGAAAVSGSHDQVDNSIVSSFEACPSSQAVDAELQTQTPDPEIQAECDIAYESDSQAALHQ